jgi:hypothetical protein
MIDFKKHPMTKEQAVCIRKLRVSRGYSWRSIAGRTAITYPEFNIKTHPNGDGYQGEGMDLCSEAAEFFGENVEDEPWN